MTEYSRRSQTEACAPTGRRQRSSAARRLARRPDILGCECVDPWAHHCVEHPTGRELDAWTAAAEHLDDAGLNASVPVEIARRMWRNGGPHRDLAVRIAPPQN